MNSSYRKSIYVLISFYDKKSVPNNSEYIMIDELARKATSKDLVHLLFKYSSVTLLCSSLEMLPMPFMIAGVCRLMTLGRCQLIDDRRTMRIHLHTLLGMFAQFIRDSICRKRVLNETQNDICALENEQINVRTFNELKVAYVRTDEPCHIDAGGSVGHIAGVINNLESVTHHPPVFVSTERIPTVSEEIDYYEFDRMVPYRNNRNINPITYNEVCFKNLCDYLGDKRIDLIYHRYSLGSYAVAKYALKNKIPYIIEYNGSEVWILKNWAGNSMSARHPYMDILSDAERVLLTKANLITCVSKPLKDQLIDMGIAPDRIIVNANGVDTDKYRPDIDGSDVRSRYSISYDKIVIGFIGTFGAWHGAERLAQVYVDLASKYGNVHLLMIGDGIKMPEVKEALSVVDSGRYTLTGMVPQEEGPTYLAACDILVSPTIPNPDGTPFFGSPTKTFEYMAMGKAIVVSDMDQMGEVFENEQTALMCVPGDNMSLFSQLCRLIEDDELRTNLGSRARVEAVLNHSWRKHTEIIVESFRMYCDND